MTAAMLPALARRAPAPLLNTPNVYASHGERRIGDAVLVAVVVAALELKYASREHR